MKKIFLLILLLIPLLFNVSCNDEENKEVITYTVSFVNDDVLEEVTVKENDKVSKPVDPVKDGFEFIGWYLNDELFSFESQIVSNITLNAKYEEVIKTYNVLVLFDNNEIKFNDITKLSIDDITKIDGYEYIGLYTDSLYENEFDGNVNSNITLYLKYKKYHSVLVKTDKEEISLKVYHGEKIDANIFYEKGYKNCIFIGEYSSQFNANTEKIYKDLELELKEGLTVSFYEDDLLKERRVVSNNSVLDDELYKYKYDNYELYTDKEYTNKFNYKTKITEDTNIYLKPIKVDDTKVKVQINIKDSYGNISYTHVLYIDKGEALREGFVIFVYQNIYNSEWYGDYLYYDEECTLIYNYGPVYEDTVLYGYGELKVDTVNVTIVYENDGDAHISVSLPVGSSITEEYKLITNGEAFDGFYYHNDLTKPYNGEPIYEETLLIIKTREFTEEDNIHNVKVYTCAKDFSLTGINGLIDYYTDIIKYPPEFDFYVKDGEVISPRNLGVRMSYYAISDFYNATTKSMYNGEPITEDTVLYGIMDFGGNNNSYYDYYIEIFKIGNSYYNYDPSLIVYNDKENNTLMFIPNNNQKIITIVDNLNNSYQIFASLNSVITKEEILEIMNAKNINTENIEVSDIFVTKDVVIKVDFNY